MTDLLTSRHSGDRVGPYEIRRRLGAGGMATVYVAEHVGLRRLVALKIMHAHIANHEGAVERFVREARAAGRLQHANIVEVSDVGVDRGIPFLAMELLEGHSLRERFNAGVVAIEELIDLMLPVLSAVVAAHDSGVVHRDLKPDNIFLSRTPTGTVRPVVLDFGLVKDPVQPAALTNTADFLGTPFYAAPEQIRSARDVDARADQYALGVIVYEGLTGRVPFEGNSAIEVAMKAIDEEPPPFSQLRPDLPKRVGALVMRALAKDPADRFDSVAELTRELVSAVKGVVDLDSPREGTAFATPSVDEEGPTIPDQAALAQPRQKLRWIWGIAGAALLGLVVTLAVWLVPRGSEDNSSPASAAEKPGEDVLRVGVSSTMPKDKLTQQFAPLMRHLEDRLGVRFELTIVPTYAGLTDRLVRGDVLLAWIPAYEYVSAAKRIPDLELLAQPVEAERTAYQGLIIARQDGAITELDQLRGATFCYVAPTSSSGYLYPRAILKSAGLDPDRLFKEARFVESHGNVLTAVGRGDCDAGATYANMVHRAHELGYRPDDFLILATTKQIPFGPYVASPRVPPPLVSKIREELLRLEPNSAAARKLFGKADFSGFAAVQREAYSVFEGLEKDVSAAERH